MRKVIASVAVAGSLGVGGVAGLLLGTPSLSSAQNTSVNAGTQTLQVAADPGTGYGSTGTTSTTAPTGTSGNSQAVTPAAPPGGGPLAGVLDDVLKGLVDKGTINQSQADAVKAAIDAKVATLPHGRHGRGPGFMGDMVTTAAKALGMTEADLRTALQGGKTVAQVAKDKNVDLNKVIDALVAEATTKIDQAVKDGKLTADQAAQAKSAVKDKVTQQVNNPLPLGGGPGGPGGPRGRMGGPGGPAGANFVDPAAKALGITSDELLTQLRDGKTIAQVAKDKNVDLNTVIDAIVAADTAKIDQAVKDGKLTTDQATQKKANLKDRVTAMVNNPAPPGPHRGGPAGAGDPANGGASGAAKPASMTTL